jgi:hypothetical protein
MEESETRSALLHRGMSPFAGKRFSKKDAKKEQRLAGRGRTAFPRESLVTLFGAQLFLNPPDMSPSNDPAVQVGQAKFRSIPIGLRSDAVFPAWQGMHYLRNMASSTRSTMIGMASGIGRLRGRFSR